MSGTESNRTLSQASTSKASQNFTPLQWNELAQYNTNGISGTSGLGPQSSHVTLNGSYKSPVQNGTGFVTVINTWNNQIQSANQLVLRPTWMNNFTRKTRGIRKPKRIRTAFTSNQMMELEQEYTRTRYLDRTRRIELADSLHLNERTIKIWYQNRRMKEKKDRAESLDDSEVTSTTDSFSELNNGVQTLMHEQISVLHDANPHGGDYMELYNPLSTPSCIPPSAMPTMPQSAQSSLSYPVFIPEQYEPQYQQVHLQMPHYPPAYDCDGMEGITIVPPPESNNQDPVPSTDNFDQNWDLSWIQSMNISD